MSCLNCGYNCCCKCDKKRGECRLCVIQCNLLDREHPVDPDYVYADHYICFKCKKAWKSNERYSHDTLHTLKQQRHCGHDRDNNCPKCGGTGHKVGKNLRVPKQNKDKDWKLLEKLVVNSYDDLEEMEKYSFETKFIDLLVNLPGFYIHKSRDRWMRGKPTEHSRQFVIIFGDDHCPYYYDYPKHLRDYKPFLKTINEGRRLICGGWYDREQGLSFSRNKWDIIRLYVKSLSIVEWWSKLATIKKNIGFSPEKNITRNYDRCMDFLKDDDGIFDKQLKIRICKYLFV